MENIMKSSLFLLALTSVSLPTFLFTQRALASDAASEGVTSITFALDERPVDGILTAVDFRTGEFGGYDVVLRTEFYNRMNGESVKLEEIVARSLECDYSKPITVVRCEIDNRPVDGAFIKVEAIIGRDKKTFQITKETRIVNRLTGKEGVSFESVAEGLELQD